MSKPNMADELAVALAALGDCLTGAKAGPAALSSDWL